MKKFRYHMENILQVKMKLEEQAKIAYGNARLQLTKEEQKLEQLNRKKASYEEELRILRSGRLDLVKIKQCEEGIKVMEQNIKQQAVVVRNAAHRLEVARVRLNNAMVERKTQEKLKEKAWEGYLLEFEAEERKEIDELNSFHYSKKTLGEEDK